MMPSQQDGCRQPSAKARKAASLSRQNRGFAPRVALPRFLAPLLLHFPYDLLQKAHASRVDLGEKRPYQAGFKLPALESLGSGTRI